MKTLGKLLIVILLLAINSCKDKTNPVSPSNVYTIMESNFEGQGQPSLSGWQEGYPYYGYRMPKYSFSNDVPSNGGKWSIKVSPPDTTFSVLLFTAYPEQPSQSKQFRLTFWCKDQFQSNFYDVSLGAWSGSHGYSIPVKKNYSEIWVQDTINYYSDTNTIDYFQIFISMFKPNSESDTSKYILFDNFKLEEY